MRIVNRTLLAGLLLSVIAVMAPVWAATPMVDSDFWQSYALDQNGTPLYWGGPSSPNVPNWAGQLSAGVPNIAYVSKMSEVNEGYWLKSDGTIWWMGAQIQPTLTGVKQIINGDGADTLVLKNDGTVWGWGNNQGSELGIGHPSYYETTPVQAVGLTNVVSIAKSKNFNTSLAFAIKSDGTVWVWGSNQDGLFGNGQTDSTTVYSTPIQQPGLTGFTSIAAGACHAVGLKADGTVWAWGSSYLSCARMNNPVPAAGTSYALLGNGMTTVSYTPIQVPNLSGIVAIKAIRANSYALKNDGTLWAWGENVSGALGNGSTITPANPVQVSRITNVISFALSPSISTGYGHGVAEKSDGSVWAWGDNTYGTVGNGTVSTPVTAPSQVLGVNGNGYLYLIPPTAADLALTFTSAPQPEVQPNYGTRYSGSVRNLGTGGATNSKVVITLPAGANFLGSASGNCSANGNIVTCILGTIWQSNSLHPNTDVGFSFEVGMIAAGSYSVTATVSSDLNDPTPGNNAIAFNSPTSTIFSSYSMENMGDDVPTLPEWGMILFAALLILSQIRQNRKTGV